VATDFTDHIGLHIGVGAGKILGVRRIFARISPNLPQKILGHFLCEYFLMKTCFSDDLQKKDLHVILGTIFIKSKLGAISSKVNHVGPNFSKQRTLGAIFSNQGTLGAIFDRISRDFAQIFRDFAKIFTNFAQISTNFTRIFRDFARIFTKSKLLGVRLHLLHFRHYNTAHTVFHFVIIGP